MPAAMKSATPFWIVGSVKQGVALIGMSHSSFKADGEPSSSLETKQCGVAGWCAVFDITGDIGVLFRFWFAVDEAL